MNVSVGGGAGSSIMMAAMGHTRWHRSAARGLLHSRGEAVATSAVPMADRERGAEGSTGSRDCVLARGSGVKSNVAGEIDKQQEREPRDAGSSEGRSRQGARAGRSGRATRERERRCVVAAEEGERGATQHRRRSTEGKREQERKASAPSLLSFLRCSSAAVIPLLLARSTSLPLRCCCCSAAVVALLAVRPNYSEAPSPLSRSLLARVWLAAKSDAASAP